MADADILPLEVFSGQDFYVPAFRLLIQGKKAPEQNNDVLSVTYQDSLTEIDSLDMTVNNWTPSALHSNTVTEICSIPGRMWSCTWVTTETGRLNFGGC